LKKEIIVSGKTIEAALANGAAELGVDSSELEYEVLELPKKGFLGIGEVPAKLKVTYSLSPANLGLAFVETLVKNMELDVSVSMQDHQGGKLINITGEDGGILIGHHGDTLDSLQYLANLAANKKEENDDREYTRISVDIENYRTKREETLRKLAHRIAGRVLKYRRNVTLEPMNPYERRIIHSEIQNIEGVTTVSVGAENNRKIVVMLEEAKGQKKGAKRTESAE